MGLISIFLLLYILNHRTRVQKSLFWIYLLFLIFGEFYPLFTLFVCPFVGNEKLTDCIHLLVMEAVKNLPISYLLGSFLLRFYACMSIISDLNLYV